MSAPIPTRRRVWWSVRAAAVLCGASLLAGGLPAVQQQAHAASLTRCDAKYSGIPKTAPLQNSLPGYRLPGPSQWSTPDAEQRLYDYNHQAMAFDDLQLPSAEVMQDLGRPESYPSNSPERIWARWKANQAGSRPYPGSFNEWVNNVYITNAGNANRGNAFEGEVARYFKLGGADWLCQADLKDLDPDLYDELKGELGDRFPRDGRRFDAVNRQTRTIYEMKSGIGYDSAQLPVDGALAKRGWRVVYINGQQPDPNTIAKYRANGLEYYRHSATPNPQFTPNKYTSASPELMSPDPQEPSTGAGNRMTGRSAPNPETARQQIERARGFQTDVGQRMRAPGGVDFTTLDLRYVKTTRTGLDYSFTAQNTDEDTAPGFGGQEKSRLISDAMFTWLALTPDKFWVNLNPDQPDRVMDAAFGTTDAGRVLLQADLAMKHDFGAVMNPDTALGARVWDSMARVDGRPCLQSVRNWIVPQPAEVRVDNGGLYILDAPLKVNSVPMAFHTPGPGAHCDLTQAQIAHNQTLLDNLVVPEVEKKINTAPQYADLRRVYTARIAAEYIRQQDAAAPGAFHKIIDSNDVKRWPLRGDNKGWTPRQTYDDYVKSFTNGDYSFKREYGGIVYTFSVGGVDFSKSPRQNVSKARFALQKPNLPAVTSGSRHEAIGYRDDGITLMGGLTGPRPTGGGGGGGNPSPTPTAGPTGHPSTSPTTGHSPTPGPTGGGGRPSTGPGHHQGGGGLASTGTQVLSVAGIAAVLLAAGAALVWWRRRKQAPGH